MVAISNFDTLTKWYAKNFIVKGVQPSLLSAVSPIFNNQEYLLKQ